MPRCGLDRRTHAGGRWSKARYSLGRCKCKCKPEEKSKPTDPTREIEDANEPLLIFAVETVPRERLLAIIHPCG